MELVGGGKGNGRLAALIHGALVHGWGHPCLLGEASMPRSMVGPGRLISTSLPPAFRLHDCVCVVGGQVWISPLNLLFLIHKLWGRLMGQWKLSMRPGDPGPDTELSVGEYKILRFPLRHLCD